MEPPSAAADSPAAAESSNKRKPRVSVDEMRGCLLFVWFPEVLFLDGLGSQPKEGDCQDENDQTGQRGTEDIQGGIGQIGEEFQLEVLDVLGGAGFGLNQGEHAVLNHADTGFQQGDKTAEEVDQAQLRFYFDLILFRKVAEAVQRTGTFGSDVKKIYGDDQLEGIQRDHGDVVHTVLLGRKFGCNLWVV